MPDEVEVNIEPTAYTLEIAGKNCLPFKARCLIPKFTTITLSAITFTTLIFSLYKLSLKDISDEDKTTYISLVLFLIGLWTPMNKITKNN